ncbi:hypothetical protein BOX15_Mlig024129g1 [Macrostomum lignano]|uniref:F-box domain-containing protein n=1 Tax=Macrostomum lignano TaxID=282301 RepID=A0A267EZW9_9PLAT|nr:hypothetical protein BOX15_Mlig024129g1 [Macrostomum lignano]
MPGQRGKTQCLADVTISQYADARDPIARLAKRVSDRRLVLSQLAEESAGTIEDFDAELLLFDEQELEQEHQEDFDGESIEPPRGRSAIRQQANSISAGRAEQSAKVYPALLWQLIGEYIHPESVSAFASLCRDARQVTQQRSFWRRLYLRWAWNPAAQADVEAPHELQRSAILACQLGVRPRVIRALHRWHFGVTDYCCRWPSGGRAPPTGLRFQRFAVSPSRRRLLVLFQRGPPPPAPKPPPDSWEDEAVGLAALVNAEAERSIESNSIRDQYRCPTEGQWLLVADLDSCGLPPHCLEDLLAMDHRYLMTGLSCLTAFSGGCGGVGKFTGSSSGAASCWCELTVRAAQSGDCRSIRFACTSAPRLLPWWRPGFLPALRESSGVAAAAGDEDGDGGGADELAGW